MYFVISAGGTAGHINPALAVADELRQRGHDILFVGTPDHLEARLAVEAGFEFASFEVAGFDKAQPLTLVTSTLKLLKASNAAQALFRERRPDAVLGFGAYVSIPVGRAAAACRVPLVIHEQNSVPGISNVYLARKADVTALTYEQSAQHLKCKNPPVTVGNPVRSGFECCTREAGRALLGIPDDAFVLLVFGGSLGARHINTAVCTLKERLLGVENLHVVHGTGSLDHDAVLQQLNLTSEEGRRWHVFSYIDQMTEVLAASDLVISRAGASSLAEIMTLGIPAVLVPYPYARGDHQTLNASGCVAAGAACLVPDAEVESPVFAQLVMDLIADAAGRQAMHEAAVEHFSGSQARTRLADIMEQQAKRQAVA